MSREPGHVVVVGGGFAGLSAAAAIAARGVRVTVLEARRTLGGRATSFLDPGTGERVDNGQHVLIGCYHDTFRFLERIGAGDGVRLQQALDVGVIDAHGVHTRLACPAWPAPLHLAGGLLRWRALGWGDRISVLRMKRALRGAVGSSDLTVRGWLEAHGQTPRLIALLWEPLAVAALNQSIDAAAAEPFRQVLLRMFSSSRGDSSLGLPLVPLDQLYAVPAQRFIEGRGGAVRVGVPASIGIAASGEPVVRAAHEQLRPAAVICAVPWYALPEVLSGLSTLAPLCDAARATQAGAIVTANLWFDRPVIAEAFVGLPGRAFHWIFDKRALFGESSSHLSLVASAADALVPRTNDEIAALALAEIHAAVPASRAAALTRAVVVRERRATFSVAPDAPPRPGVRTGVPGLFLAGDWIDTGLPATIESAVVSGHLAATAVLEGPPFSS